MTGNPLADETTAANCPKLAPARRIILGLFLFSGASGLIYEVVWSRMFALVLGTTVYAVATVLGVFMGGLALGSWLFGSVADRPKTNGLRVYGWLELCIGAFALLLPLLMHLCDAVYRAAWPAVSDSFSGLLLLRIALVAMILIVPSTLMGGTLPLLSRFLIRARDRTGREIGALYGINTVGAVVGCFTAGFFLLEALGAHGTLLAAAAMNFIVGGLALRWARRTSPPPLVEEGPATEGSSASACSSGQVRIALVLYAFSGLAALALEVLWTRSLMYFTSVDTYAFTAMLAAFLTGIGLGSLFMARFLPRVRSPLLVLAVIEVLIGLTAAASIPLFGVLYGALDALFASLPAASLITKISTKMFCSFFVMLVPTLLMGAAFPLISAIYVGAQRRIGRGVGTLYALNTVGAIVGSALAGFLVIPLLGLQGGILLFSTVFVAIGLVLWITGTRSVRGRTIALVTATAALTVAVTVNLQFTGRPAILNSVFFKAEEDPHVLIFHHEGPDASLAVLENSVGTRLLNINGITTAVNNYMDLQVHRMLSHLPMLLHPDPKVVLVVGFGMGSTPWGCIQHDVERVDVVELLRAEKLTAPFFADINHGVLSDPKLKFTVADGRNHLLATRTSYDVISFNAIHPRYSPYLYTVDFYRLCRERLSEDGVICAWMTQNSMTEVEFRMLCRSFVEVFPNASLWYCNPEHFCLVGTMEPMRIDYADWHARASAPGVRDDLADSNLDDPDILLGRFLIGGEALRSYVAGAPLNTDDRPRVEFTRSSKVEERPITERLIQLKESVLPYVEFGPDEADARDRLSIMDQASRWLMTGQLEYWFPQSDRPLRSEIAHRKAALLTPLNQDVRYNLGSSRLDWARVELELFANPPNPASLTRMAKLLREEGRLVQSRIHLERALDADPSFGPAAEQLGLIHLLENDLPAAIDLLLAVSTFKPNDARVLYPLSVAFERSGRDAEARDVRETALAADPDAAEWFDLLERNVRAMQQINDQQPAAAPV